MSRHILYIVDTHALARLGPRKGAETEEPSSGRWVRIIRTYLRMTQAELAKKAKVTQPHLAAIEADKVDPQVGTLRRIFRAMNCDVAVRPVPEIPLEDQLRGRARKVALRHLEKSMG